MPREIENQTYYLTKEACEMAGISRGTLLRWIKKGVIADVKLKGKNGWRLFSEDEMKNLKDEAERTWKVR